MSNTNILKCNKLISDIRNLKYIPGSNIGKINVLYAVLGGLLGGLGLLYNSNAVVLGSMLVSPLGSPIFRAITGIITNETNYISNGGMSLLILAVVCVVMGIIMGYVNETYSFLETPTDEMKQRVTIKHITIDIFIALIAGVTIAVATYKKDLIVIAGINLAVSILPPLVNGGLYYGKYLKNIKNNIEDNDQLLKDGNTSVMLAIANITGIIITALITLKFLC